MILNIHIRGNEFVMKMRQHHVKHGDRERKKKRRRRKQKEKEKNKLNILFSSRVKKFNNIIGIR